MADVVPTRAQREEAARLLKAVDADGMADLNLIHSTTEFAHWLESGVWTEILWSFFAIRCRARLTGIASALATRDARIAELEASVPPKPVVTREHRSNAAKQSHWIEFEDPTSTNPFHASIRAWVETGVWPTLEPPHQCQWARGIERRAEEIAAYFAQPTPQKAGDNG